MPAGLGPCHGTLYLFGHRNWVRYQRHYGAKTKGRVCGKDYTTERRALVEEGDVRGDIGLLRRPGGRVDGMPKMRSPTFNFDICRTRGGSVMGQAAYYVETDPLWFERVGVGTEESLLRGPGTERRKTAA